MGEICKSNITFYDSNTINRAFMAHLVPEIRSKHYIKKMRDPIFSNYVDNVENWSLDKKYEFLDIMTDLVTKNYTIEEVKEIIKKIYGKLDTATGFEEISTLREKANHISPEHKKLILVESLTNLKRDIHELSKINFKIMLNYSDDFEKLREFTSIGSAINLQLKYIDFCLDDLKRKNNDYKKRYNYLLVFSLRFLAYLMNKITLEDLITDTCVFGNVIYEELGIGDEDFKGISSFQF